MTSVVCNFTFNYSKTAALLSTLHLCRAYGQNVQGWCKMKHPWHFIPCSGEDKFLEQVLTLANIMCLDHRMF